MMARVFSTNGGNGRGDSAWNCSVPCGSDPMPDIGYPFILWPVGIAVGGYLFFEIARRT